MELSYTVFALADGGFGYIVERFGIKIRQEIKPAIAGNIIMTQSQANKIGDLVDKKIQFHLNPAVTVQQVNDLLNNIKTATQIVNDELGI